MQISGSDGSDEAQIARIDSCRSQAREYHARRPSESAVPSQGNFV